MPLKLIPPKPGRTPFWKVRGTHLGVYVDRSTKASERKVAARLKAKWEGQIERNSYSEPGEPTFAGAAVTYIQSGGEMRFLEPIVKHFGDKPLRLITQDAVDSAAHTLYPTATAATRNRQVYSPISAVLKRAGRDDRFKRPIGGRGSSRLDWLSPEQAADLFEAARSVHPRFGALCVFLTYTGVRLSEALRLEPADLDLPAGQAFIRDTKNADPLMVHLPPVVVAALANLPMTHKRAFGFAKGGRIYSLLSEASAASGVPIPDRVAFHIFRHTYGAWMRRYGGLDTAGLVATKRWKSRQAAAVYEHVDVTAEAKKADLLPVRNPGKTRRTSYRPVKNQGVG